jgi:hypothetical protein
MLMKSALFWAITQLQVVIFTDLSDNVWVPYARVKKSKKSRILGLLGP